MTGGASLDRARAAALNFALPGDLIEVAAHGTGHINATFVVTMDQAGTHVRYLLQLLNTHVFREPTLLMDNVVRVTEHLRRRMAADGIRGLSRRTLTVVRSLDGSPFWRDGGRGEGDGFWRCYLFIEGAHYSDLMDSTHKAFALGAASGRFLEQVSDLPGPRLAETIPNFHNARTRYAAFEKAVAEDQVGRVASVAREIAFFRENLEGFDRIVAALASGEAPERITHNDTKISNLLVDDETGEAICVIDLDTVMPGSTAYDFGDLVRTVPISTSEDDPEPGRMVLVPEMFAALSRGFASGTMVPERAAEPKADPQAAGRSFLTEREIELLPVGARVITMLMGIRFLTDFLDGDRYYKVARDSHNLDRCRTQIALVRSMDSQASMMRETTLSAFAALCQDHAGRASGRDRT